MIEFIVSFNQLLLYTIDSKEMRNDPVLSSMSFTILGLQVTFGVEAELLKMKVTPLDYLKPSQLALTRMSVEPSAIQLSISQYSPTKTQKTSSYTNLSVANCYQNVNPSLQEKVASLENTVKLLQEKLMSKSQSKKDLKKSSSSQGRFGQNGSRNNMCIPPSFTIHENQENQYAEMIQQQVEQNAKLQLLNDLLQEKILERESMCIEFEKRLMEREELIRELADKLIVANIEKEDIFNEYEKILQNNVFHRMEQTPTNYQKNQNYVQEITASEEESLSQTLETETVATINEQPLIVENEKETTCG